MASIIDGYCYRLSFLDPSRADAPSEEDMVIEAQRRYALTLWGGECLAPMREWVVGTLRVVDRAINAASPVRLAPIFAELLVPISTLTRKMRHDIPCALPSLAPSAVTNTQRVEHRLEGISPIECAAITDALSSGPASAVAPACRGQPNGLLRQWLSAIESRELQLQILLTLLAMKVCVQFPNELELWQQRTHTSKDFHKNFERQVAPSELQSLHAHEHLPQGEDDSQAGKTSHLPSMTESRPPFGSQHDSQMETQPDPQTESQPNWQNQQISQSQPAPTGGKRKRKSMSARWLGLGNPLVRKKVSGVAQRQSDNSDLSDTEVSLSPAALASRFESLTDKLCLLCAMPSDLDVSGPEAAVVANFGTGGRERGPEDERDEAQWLCSSLVEPTFSGALPRQCNLLRSKCFVAPPPAAASPASKERTSPESVQRPRKSFPRRRASARVPVRPGLRSLLQEEQLLESAEEPWRRQSSFPRQTSIGRAFTRSVSMDPRSTTIASLSQSQHPLLPHSQSQSALPSLTQTRRAAEPVNVFGVRRGGRTLQRSSSLAVIAGRQRSGSPAVPSLIAGETTLSHSSADTEDDAFPLEQDGDEEGVLTLSRPKERSRSGILSGLPSRNSSCYNTSGDVASTSASSITAADHSPPSHAPRRSLFSRSLSATAPSPDAPRTATLARPVVPCARNPFARVRSMASLRR